MTAPLPGRAQGFESSFHVADCDVSACISPLKAAHALPPKAQPFRYRFVPALVALASVATAPLNAQDPASPHSWQKLNSASVQEVQRHWQTPPAEYGPEPYYGLNGPFTIETVQRDLDTMRSLGFRAVTVQYGFGSSFTYLSPEYLAFFRQFVLEAKKRDLRLWIVDDAGYPSGFAGGKFSAEHPELRMQALVANKVPVPLGGQFDQQMSPETVAVTAFAGNDAATQIPLVNGHARWSAPAAESGGGGSTVYVVEHAFRTSPTRSDTNPKRVKDGSQSLEDYLDPAATAQYLTFTHEAYKKIVGDEFGKTILGFRGDEPDYSISGLPWTPKFFDRFTALKGYDARPHVAALLQGREVVLTPEQTRFKADYYDVFATLFRDGFFKPQADWCAANGLEYQVHLNHEELEIQLAHSEGDFFRDMKFVQIPGVDSIWHQIWPDTISDFPRLASSAAHVYGHPRALTESFAAYRPLPDIHQARYILDEQFVRGINLIETMYFPASSTPTRGGPMAFMRDPGYPLLMQYAGRLGYLMSMGKPAAQVALLLPASSLWMGDTHADDTFVSTERLLSEHQIDFDIVGEDSLASEMKLQHGDFLSESGNRYGTVLVPRADLLPEPVVPRLRTFAEGGGHVLFLGKTPAMIGTHTLLHARPAALAEFRWATVVNEDLPPTPTPPAEPPTVSPAAMEVPAALLAAIRSALPTQSVELSSPDTALRFTQRKLQDATVLLLFNESESALANELKVHVQGKTVEVWDPNTGEVRKLSSARRQGKDWVLPLSLLPYATEVLVVRGNTAP